MKQKIIIFEGVDGTGKSEIAEELSKYINAKPYKCKKEWSKDHNFKTAIEYTTEAIIQFLEQTGSSVILDRFVMSEQVYSHVYKRETLPKINEEHDQRLADLGAVIVYCYRDPHTWVPDPHNITPFEQYQNICDAYDIYLGKTKCNVITLDVTEENLTRQVRKILSGLMMIETSEDKKRKTYKY